ncbi:MAG TPA: xanthine dehydrogenase family protein molybdopterin-binding subunit, partial [Hyphomicrobiaceae bacterium]|nr:xanthine dehydrogenase family protein molybdopterin-binding subunit [Hyphomicrobiaceae bacterium]
MQEKVNKGGQPNYKIIGTRPVRPDGVDKVTGRARFGADMKMAGQLVGKVLRSPHPHARIRSIDTKAAAALPGVKAVVTGADFNDQPSEFVPAGEMLINYRDVVRNIMAREKALFEGHPVAAVAAISDSVAKAALKLIRVDYEVLPHVIDEVEAMKPGAPILHEDLITAGVTPPPAAASNVAKRVEFTLGNADEAFKDADVIVEREFKTKPVHQGYIEPHACVASVNEDGLAELWTTTQGHWIKRAHCAKLLGWDISKLRVTSSEIGGGFGGKTVVYLEPVALALSKKARRPVKMVMSREEVFRASGPTSGATVWVKMGAKRDGRIVAAAADLKYQAGAFQGSPVQPGAMCAFAPYDLEHVKVVGYDVVSNRPKVAAYRAPGGPISEYAVECVVDELAEKIGMDPIELRLKNAAREGTKAAYGPKFGPVGLVECLEAAKASEHWKTPLKPNQGRGIAAGFWFNIGGETTVSLQLNEDGTMTLMAGTPDIGGLRASLCMMAAEELGVSVDSIKPIIADTSSLGYNFLTGGSRSTFSSGMATVEAARSIIKEACSRAAKLWELSPDAVTFENGEVKPAGDNAGKHKPMSLKDVARAAGKTGGPIVGYSSLTAHGAAPSFGVHVADVEVDPETAHTKIVRYTVIQDAGRAIHPAYVEGQFQGGAVQGIGWALNEEYIYGKDGKLQNAGFLDYRIPV